MNINIDPEKGRKAARLLYDAFRTTGIHGHNDMPEDILPVGIGRGSLEHLIFITLTVSIDYMRDANLLWAASRKSQNNPKTAYLYKLPELNSKSINEIIIDMQLYKLSKKPEKDANTWRTNGVSFYTKWGGDPRKFLESCDWDALIVLKRLRKDNHRENGVLVNDFPSLRGPKIGPLWIRMLRDNVGITCLKNLDKVPIPVDKHIARSTLALGIVKGEFDGTITDLSSQIHEAWFESVKGILAKKERMIALDLDESLWHLSKYGCSHRNKESGYCYVFNRCELKVFCIPGKIDISSEGYVELDT
jgi:hypothetical protein